MMQLTTLGNGLRIASRPMQSVETAAVGLYCQTGSRFEPNAANGIAHLFEHMVFKGAGGRSARQISETIENAGGDLNAMTDRELTSFHAALLAPDLPLGVALIADLIRRPHFENRHLELEKKVVLQELAETRDTGSDIVFDHLQEVAFPGQAIGRSVLGDERSVQSITVEQLQQWLATHYIPNRMILVAAGKLEHDQLVELGDRHFGDLEPGPVPIAETARFDSGERAESRHSQQSHIALAMPAPAWGSADANASQLFADAVGSGASSRLFQELREEQGLAYSVAAGAQNYSDCGIFWTYAATSPDDCEWAGKEVQRVLAEAAETLAQSEIDRARALAKSGMMMALESCWGQASYLASRLLREGRLTEPSEIIARLDKVSLDEVRAIGRQMLAGPRARAMVGNALATAA